MQVNSRQRRVASDFQWQRRFRVSGMFHDGPLVARKVHRVFLVATALGPRFDDDAGKRAADLDVVSELVLAKTQKNHVFLYSATKTSSLNVIGDVPGSALCEQVIIHRRDSSTVAD